MNFNRSAINRALEFQKVLQEYRMYGIQPSMSEIRQRYAESPDPKLTMAGAARQILQRKIREAP
jgi:membrane protein insertase Oxa1/YidC/SpoIIIJ